MGKLRGFVEYERMVEGYVPIGKFSKKVLYKPSSLLLITLFNLISGVFPMRESIFSWTSKSCFIQEHNIFANLGKKN